MRRASSPLTPVRAGAALAAIVAAVAIYGVAASDAFAYGQLRLDGARFTDPAAVERALAGIRGRNLFSLDTDPLEAALSALGTVSDARVAVELPDTLHVTLKEREPLLVWGVGDRRFLVDGEGRLFAELGASPPADAAGLPVVEDARAASAGATVGTVLDPVDLDAATRLGSLVPGDVGSAAQGLAIRVTDENGFVVRAVPDAWAAVFGFYTESLRTPDLIPEQVRLLRSLMAGREATIDRVVLASGTDGTYTERESPKPSRDSPTPTETP